MKNRNGTIHFLPMNIRAEASPKESILEVALRYKLDLGHSCGGMGSCTTCRVIVEKNVENLPPRNELESERAEERGFKTEERLACQTPALANLVVRIPGQRDRT